MSQPFRIPGHGLAGGPLRFTFDGVAYHGMEGDTIASALLANGVHLMGRSFKYHRPRGVLGAGVEEPNALVGITRGPGRVDPNRLATTELLADGLTVESQNRSPSLAFDRGALSGLLSALIPAGFYYKTFMWPRGFWARVYEPAIRRMAGLGRAPDVADPDRYAQRWAHAETLIVGGGPAGLAAALAASRTGERIILCDQDPHFGGALHSDAGATIDDAPARAWIERVVAELSASPSVRLLPRTTAFGYGIDNLVTLAQRCDDSGTEARERQWLVRAGRVILATGSIERPLLFSNNDRPGIMLAGAARTFLHRFGVAAGRMVTVLAAHDSGYRAALDLAAAGAGVTIVDGRPEPPADLLSRARTAGITVMAGHVPVDTRGRLRVSAIAVSAVDGDKRRWIACDLVLMAGGWTPSIHLHSQSGGKPVWDPVLDAFVPGDARQAQVSVGACGGHYALARCLVDGWVAGGGPASEAPVGVDREDVGMSLGAAQNDDGMRRKAFVDFQNDVTAGDIRLALREGFQSVEHLKRYTTTGMATDQGRTSNLNALAIAAQTLGRSIPEIGLTTFRAPFTPTTFGVLAGVARDNLFEPERRTPTHDLAVAAGAVFEDVGQWKRARYFPKAGEDMDAAVSRECRAVRSVAGMLDASTLGKIEVVGPDAGAFLDFIYTGRFSTLAVGRCRYALMLGENGFIADDGVIGRLAQDRYHVTTTTGGAARVFAMMEDVRQTELPDLKVWITSTTEQWAVIVLNGPAARAILEPLVDGIAMADADFPHMAVREGTVEGVSARLFRVSFTGELGFEINVPAQSASAVWDGLRRAGEPAGLTLYGTEALHVLRAEKGYIIVGQETDGTVTADDVGLSTMVAMKKRDFLGKRSLTLPALAASGRKQLVALLPYGQGGMQEGMQVVDPSEPGVAIGHVTSAYFSDALGRHFALALVRNGRGRIGRTVAVPTPAGLVAADIGDPVQFDRAGARLHG